eukprot:1159459-Pelagomonas_calceolata.AAC.6
MPFMITVRAKILETERMGRQRQGHLQNKCYNGEAHAGTRPTPKLIIPSLRSSSCPSCYGSSAIHVHAGM